MYYVTLTYACPPPRVQASHSSWGRKKDCADAVRLHENRPFKTYTKLTGTLHNRKLTILLLNTIHQIQSVMRLPFRSSRVTKIYCTIKSKDFPRSENNPTLYTVYCTVPHSSTVDQVSCDGFIPKERRFRTVSRGSKIVTVFTTECWPVNSLNNVRGCRRIVLSISIYTPAGRTTPSKINTKYYKILAKASSVPTFGRTFFFGGRTVLRGREITLN